MSRASAAEGRAWIVEEGTHDELLRDGGRYADFWQISMAAATGGCHG